MKYLLWCSLFIIVACAGCNSKPELKGSLMHVSGKNFSIFVNLRDTSFYLIQLRDTVSVKIPNNCDFLALDNDTLFLKDLNTSQTVHFNLDKNIYGIGSYRGNEYFELLTDSGRHGFKFRSNVGDLVSLMSCHCFPTGETHNCTYGGTNTLSCSSRLAHKVGKETWFHSCEVSCAQGYSSCCN
ncbi:MAG: hypothetical protein ABJC12_06355 [Saprospiraceae bacterium]